MNILTERRPAASQSLKDTLFLTSDAAVSITGTSIAVDGGWTAH
jgi:enoyl-[acyl-carrier-protein] reductase (NADH)